MIHKHDILTQAVNNCMKDLYSLAQPFISIEDFEKECKTYSDKYKAWERFRELSKNKDKLSEFDLKEYSKFPSDWEGKNITECIGPRPYEFYYLPKEVYQEIVDSYVHVYDLDKHQDLLDTIQILKDYCNKPIVDKYIEDYTDEHGNHHPGYRGYDHPDNLYKEIAKIVSNYSLDPANENSDEVIDLCNKFFEFLDMAGKFFNWNGDLNSFYMSVYLGAGPSSNKQGVIDNWKIYKNKNIEIDDSKFNKEQDYD